jgi:hypothetical protein
MLQLLSRNNKHRILLLITGLFVSLLGMATIMVPPGLDPDPSWGFLVMHCMEQGMPFNMLVSPSPHNIAANQAEFLAWWSPGQYLMPYVFKSLFHINTGRAVALTIAICNLVGIAGLYQLFKQLGFSKWIAAISTAFIATQLFYIASFSYYPGGEVLMFAFMPWFLYGCLGFKRINWQLLVFLFIGGLIGFFSKSSVLWMYAASLACVWINVSWIENQEGAIFNLSGNAVLKKSISKWLRNGIMLAVPFICAIAVIYLFYLCKGPNPTSDHGPLLVRPETFTFPLASPMVSGFSIDDLVDGLIYQPDGPKISYHAALAFLFVFSFCCLAYLFSIGKLSPGKKYAVVFATFYIVGILFFSYMYLRQATISFEGRHFRIIGLLFVPGVVYLLFKTRITKAAFLLIWLYFLYIGYRSFRDDYKGNMHAAKGNTGLSQLVYSKQTIKELVKIDSLHQHNATIVVTAPDLGMEVKNNRVLIIDDETPDAEFARLRYAGKAGTLYILVPQKYIGNGRLANMVKAFVDYHNFHYKKIGTDYFVAFAE